MSLGHVYIVLEPVGSARLTFDDDWYYEFMSFDVPKVGVPDEITDMTRSLKMVERKILIYRTMVFGHRKCFGGYQVVIGSPERSFEHPWQRYGPNGPKGGQTSPWYTPALDSRP